MSDSCSPEPECHECPECDTPNVLTANGDFFCPACGLSY